jgi:diguanylate cyclase
MPGKTDFHRLLKILGLTLFFAVGMGLLVIEGIQQLYEVPKAALPLDDSWTYEGASGISDSGSLPLYLLNSKEKAIPQGIIVFSYSFSLSKEIAHPILLLPYLAGNALRVFIDNDFIGQVGDMRQGRSSVWNSSHRFDVPQPLLPGRHEIRIEINHLYEAGILVSPYLLEGPGIPWKSRFLCFYSHELMYIIHGILLVLGSIFIGTGAMSLPSGWGKIGIGIAHIFIAVFLLDYSLIPSLPFSYLVWKKTANASLHLAMAALLVTYKPFVEKKPDVFALLLFAVELVLAVLLVIIPKDILQLRTLYSLFHLTIFLSMIYLLISGIPLLRANFRLVFLLGGLLFALYLASHDVISLFLGRGVVFYSHVGIFGFLITASLIIILDVLAQYRIIMAERRRADSFYERSMKDPLTGAYNRNIIEKIEDDLRNEYALLLFDLDDFKMINDTYGHDAGDLVLKNLVKTIKDNTRSRDILIRLGGDEFALILPDCTIERVEEISKKIDEAVSREKIYCETETFSYSCSSGVSICGGESFEACLKRADKGLYEKKELRRNRRNMGNAPFRR